MQRRNFVTAGLPAPAAPAMIAGRGDLSPLAGSGLHRYRVRASDIMIDDLDDEPGMHFAAIERRPKSRVADDAV